MEFNKWLKRKYPKNYQKILEGFNDMNDLENMFKIQGYKPAIWASKNGDFSMVSYGQLVLGACFKEYSWEDYNGLCDVTHTSETWLGTYDCRFYVAGKENEQHRVYNKYWEYLKE